MQTQLNSGDRIGDWVVVEPLGAGGMGSVYRCHSALTQQVQAAIKVLTIGHVKDAKERFVREIEVLASMDHPNIVRVLGGGEDANTHALYLVMELVPGKDLTWYIEGRALPWADACRIVRDVASGLAEAHSKKVHHRDLKPANIMLGDDGRVKLIDFGIAIQDGKTRLTRHQGVPGTMSYMPPEVFTQGRAHDPALGDIYSLGVCLHEALTGIRAYPEAADLTTMQRFAEVMGAKSRDAFLDPGSTVPDEVREIVKAATARNPTQRIQDAASLANALHEVIADQVDDARAFTPAPATRRPKSTEDTFTLDADPKTMAPPPPPPPRSQTKLPTTREANTEREVGPAVDKAQPPKPRVRRSARAAERPRPKRGLFPLLSLGMSTLLAATPGLWTGFCILLCLVSLEGGLITLAVSLVFAPIALPVLALPGLVFTLWFAGRVRSSSTVPLLWWCVALALAGVHSLHVAFAIGDGIFIATLMDDVAQEDTEKTWRDYVDNF